MISTELLADLAARASTLDERLEPPFLLGTKNEAGRIDARVSRWAELGCKGDRERLQRSLRWRGIDLDRVRPALGRAFLPPDAVLSGCLPRWVLRFANLIEAALSEHRSANPVPMPAPEWTPLIIPFARAASAEMRRSIPGEACANVAEDVFLAMERSLLLRLTRLARPVLAGEYYIFSYTDSRSGGDPESRAQRFIDRMLQPEIPKFLMEYPVLARLVTLVCDNWKAAVSELLCRLAEDRKSIFAQFHGGCDPGPVVDIRVGDADVHDEHREVVILGFKDGFQIVYKPRSMALDQAFHELVGWLNERGLPRSLRSPGVSCRDGYGWAEFIPHCLADGAEELKLFYERAGALACVAYVMGATDLHHRNVIAQGGYPIVIDLETMLMAEPRSGALPESLASGKITHSYRSRSVLQSMLFPLVHRVPAGSYSDLSALGAEPEGKVAAEEDGIWLPAHGVSLRQMICDHAGAIEAGFVSAYRFIESQREALLSDCGPLAAFERCPIRVVLRDTALYFQLLRHSIDPSVLQDGVDRMIALERLNHVIAIADSPPSFLEMVTREQNALAGLDIPRFLVMSDETDLRDATGLVARNVMERTPLAEMQLRIEGMGEDDLQKQRIDIRWALSSHISGQPGLLREDSPPVSAELPDTARLIADAERLGRDIFEQIEAHEDVPPTWRGPIYLSAARRFTVGDAGASLANGGLGVAIFFAALFCVTGNPEWRSRALDLSLRHLAPASTGNNHHGHIVGGIMAGLGGVLYGTALIAALLESDEVLGSGLALARRLAGRVVTEEKELSLADGLAGDLLGIVSLNRLTLDVSLEHIIQRGAIRLRNAKPLTSGGLLSGQAGLALAARAIGLTSDFSIPAELSTQAGLDWAEGGVGLSVAILKAVPNSKPVLDFLENLAWAPMAADDSFAFGTSGEADALVWAADRCGRPEFRRLAVQRIADAMERTHRGTPRLLGGKLGDGLRMPGLLHGTAGIGYVLLRLAEPDRLPALAAFDLPVDG